MRRTILPLLALVGLLSLALAITTCAPQRDNSSDKDETAETKPPVPDSLKKRIEVALKVVHDRPLSIHHNFWTVFHAILGMGFETELVEFGPNQEVKKKVKAIDYIRQGRKLSGLKFLATGSGVDVETKAGSAIFQGHQDQFVAEMAQWGLAPDTEFLVDGKEFKFADFHLQSKMHASVTKNQELSWAILIIAQYFGTDHQWTNSDGEKLKFEDVVHYELNQPVDDTAACGGTHRLFGFTWAYHLHRKNGGKKEGVWKEAADKIEYYKAQAKESQNKDFGWVKYVSGREDGEDLASSGHVIEWLALALTRKELEQGWVEDGANELAMSIIKTRQEPVESGALYHAAHGLHIYYNRRWGPLGSDPVIPLPPKD
jgi:hypothetical protein